MRVVISGGTGMIGRALITDLAANGHEVIVLSRNPEAYRNVFSDNVIFESWDGRTVGDWVHRLDGAQVVVNFAGENLAGEGFLPDRWTDEKKRRIRTSRIDAGKAIVEALKSVDDKPEVLLQSSAIGYYGPRGDEIITESAAPGDDFLGSIAVEWEAVTKPAEDLGLRRVVARTGLVLAKEGGPLGRVLLPYKLYGGIYFGDGKQWWSWIHMVDEVRALRFLIENESAAGSFNLTAPNPVTNREFGKILGKVLGRPSFLPIPRFAMNLFLGEVSTVVMDGQRIMPAKLEELGFTFQFDDLESALRDILGS